jgi:hypothetical protein
MALETAAGSTVMQWFHLHQACIDDDDNNNNYNVYAVLNLCAESLFQEWSRSVIF